MTKVKSVCLRLSIKDDKKKYNASKLYFSKLDTYTQTDLDNLKEQKIDLDYSLINKKVFYG